MVSHPMSRAGRRLAGGLVVLAFLVATAGPVHAGVRDAATPATPALSVLDWIQDLLAHWGFGAEEPAVEEPAEPVSIWGRDCAVIDPNGNPCPEADSTEPPATLEVTTTVGDSISG